MNTSQAYETTLTTIAQSIYGAVQFTDSKNLNLVDIMGYTSLAFRIRIDPFRVDTNGPGAHIWQPFYEKALLNLGFNSICYDPIVFPVPLEDVKRALTLIHESLDNGVPAISFALNSPDFCIVYGYDDDRKLLHVKDSKGETMFPYEKLSEGKIVVLVLKESYLESKSTKLRNALALILFHARHREPGLSEYWNGFSAYDAWINAFTQRTIDEIGNSYNIAYITDARTFALEFLKNAATSWPDDDPIHNRMAHGTVPYKLRVAEWTSKAAAQYSKVVHCFEQLQMMFPFPQGGNPNDPEQAGKAIELLKEAKAAEENGIALLEELYYWL
jgi:hypothetical protein